MDEKTELQILRATEKAIIAFLEKKGDMDTRVDVFLCEYLKQK